MHFLTTFQQIQNRHEILRILISFFFSKLFIFCHISTFENFEAKRTKKAQKIKNRFSKCVLDLNFAPIKGSAFVIF
jgi:hypothetical protein